MKEKKMSDDQKKKDGVDILGQYSGHKPIEQYIGFSHAEMIVNIEKKARGSFFKNFAKVFLKKARIAMNLSQDELAAKLGKSSAAISAYERGIRGVPSEDLLFIAFSLQDFYKLPTPQGLEAIRIEINHLHREHELKIRSLENKINILEEKIKSQEKQNAENLEKIKDMKFF